MSRAIKFRVWDKDGKLIGVNRFEKGRWQCQMLQEAGGSGEWSNGVLHGQTMDQFTGLHDTNDQEIYEADVVNVYDTPETPEARDFDESLVVEFREGQWWWGNGGNAEPLYDISPEYMQIIGNVHGDRDLPKSAEASR
jgi:uncharacterized phage protein (TIGR01671 family)